MQEGYKGKGLEVIGITEEPFEKVETYARQLDVTYPILAEAKTDAEAYGVRFIWGSEFRLVAPDGKVVSEDLEEIEEMIAQHLGPPRAVKPKAPRVGDRPSLPRKN